MQCGMVSPTAWALRRFTAKSNREQGATSMPSIATVLLRACECGVADELGQPLAGLVGGHAEPAELVALEAHDYARPAVLGGGGLDQLTLVPVPLVLVLLELT